MKNRNFNFQFPLLFILLFFLSGCSSSVHSIVPVPKIPPAVKKNAMGTIPGHPVVFVDQIKDARSVNYFVDNRGSYSSAAGDLTLSVSEGLKQALKDTGFELEESAPVIVTGEIRDWVATLGRGGVSSRAKLYIEVYDPANKKIYSGTYEGFSDFDNPSINTEDVTQSLGTAMAETISQVLGDQKLLGLLSSF